MRKCAVFDLDGTLLNTLDSIAYFANCELAKHGLSPIDSDKYKYFVGDGAAELMRRAFLYHGITLSETEILKISADYVSGYNADCCYLTEVFDGIYELLSELKGRHIKVCVFSNKPHSSVVPIVEHFFGNNTFDIVKGSEAGRPRKPDPTVLLEMLNSLDVSPSECAFIGDSSVDMKTGKNSGAVSIGVLWGFRTKEELLENGADYIVSKASEILNKM